MVRILELKNLSKSFGSLNVLKDIDFTVDEGEFVYLTGPSGSGKTTILKLILGEIIADSGEIILDSEDLTKISKKMIPKLRQRIGTVFQDFKILPERTVEENVEVALAVMGLPMKEWDPRVDHVLKLVGLSERSDYFPSQLAGGELQRVSLARALVVNPKIILADEPTGNLDWDTAEKIMELFELVNKEGKTILMATHNQVLIEKHKHRILRIDNGKITEDSGNKEKKEKAEDNKKDKDKETEAGIKKEEV
jgi:cell division transport system ATP-binding protein